jgi:hypothetical protein
MSGESVLYTLCQIKNCELGPLDLGIRDLLQYLDPSLRAQSIQSSQDLYSLYLLQQS